MWNSMFYYYRGDKANRLNHWVNNKLRGAYTWA